MALVYSCCFWFSLRLGGIFISIFSAALAVLISCCVAYSYPQNVKHSITSLINSMNLMYTRTYFENLKEEPDKYLSLGISFTCIYILFCLLFAYGAYTFKNVLMIGYILLELLRLFFLVFGITTWLLILKENTMDIGVLIGTSVAGSFFLLGMFYLWICAANLPVLINEMERDEQAATIYKLQKMLNTNQSMSTQGLKTVYMSPMDSDLNSYRKPIFSNSFKTNNLFKQTFERSSQYPMSFHFNSKY